MAFTIRVATASDAPRLRPVMDAAIAELQQGFLTPEQIESSRLIMGIDSQLIEDGTYYVVEDDGQIAGCGGWSRRATLYGGDSLGRSGRTPARPGHRASPGAGDVHEPGVRPARRGSDGACRL